MLLRNTSSFPLTALVTIPGLPLQDMSIEVHNPHLVNSLVADAERRNFRAYPAAPTRKPNKTLYKTLPVPPPHQPTSADIICVSLIDYNSR